MSLNSPRSPRPPRPGGSRTNSRPEGPTKTSGIQSGGSAAGKSDFGDTRTVILSRKSMGMHQRKKEEVVTPVEQAPMPKAVVVDESVHCTSCPGSFPIVGDEYYGAVVECPDCAAEFIIPTKQELNAMTAESAAVEAASPSKPPESKNSRSSAISKPPVKEKPIRKVVRSIPGHVESDLNDDEDVYVCKSEAGSSGGAIIGALLVLLTGVAGVVPAVVDLNSSAAIAIPMVTGVLLAIVSFVIAKIGSGSKVLVVTNKRVFSRSGKWFAESNLD